MTCWRANATGPALMARVCAEHGITLVHVSSDYVFDGTRELHPEDEPFAPMGVYGQSKAAGDLAVGGCPKHYIARSSWVIGDGRNFVKTMMSLSDRVAAGEISQVTVVDDQVGRLSFTRNMAEGIFWLLGYREGDVEPSSPAPYGTYNLTGSGEPKSWAQIAKRVFELANGNADKVVPVATADYYAGVAGPVSPRPEHSAMDLSKIVAIGFNPSDWERELDEYVKSELTK